MTQDGDDAVTVVHDGDGHAWEVMTVTAPASWATALVNNDWSGLETEPEDAAACRAWMAEQAEDGWRVIDTARDEDGEGEEAWFSSSADLYGSPWSGADLLRYVRQRRAPG